MSRRTIRIIIVLASVLFIGLISTQIFWVRRAYLLAEQQISHEIELALISVVKDIQKHSGDSTFLVDPVKRVNNNFYLVQINEELQPYYLESLLKTEFLNREINYDFQYSIYNCFNDSVVFTSTVLNEQDLAASTSQHPAITWDKDGHYFSVFFPTLNFEIVSQMNFWIVSSAMLLIVMVFFAYVINVILKQKRLSEIKNDFINNMTHELKTPISTIALASDVLLQNGIENHPERLRNYAQIIKTENQRLQSQVERVLQIAKVDRDGLQLNRQWIDLHEIIELAVSVAEMNFSDKNIEFVLKLEATDHQLFADEMHITNIIYNLIDNAAKYSGDNPHIEISTTSNNRELILKIKDNGPGIAKEHQKRIFEKFYRIPTGNVHDVKGFGLGLHYVKMMTEAHSGTVKLTSQPGHGTTFELVFPIDKKNDQNHDKERSHKGASG
ncbi:MAG: HAMP domain-containing sensor histidine kinase [Salibacteraceae bacterium]